MTEKTCPTADDREDLSYSSFPFEHSLAWQGYFFMVNLSGFAPLRRSRRWLNGFPFGLRHQAGSTRPGSLWETWVTEWTRHPGECQ